MAEILGRKCTISVGGAVVATARTKSLTINNEPIDITSDGDDGIQRILSVPGQHSWEISLDGLYTGDALIVLATGTSNLLTEVILNYGAGAYTLTGDFFIASYSESLPYNEATTFSATLQSSGAVVKAPVV